MIKTQLSIEIVSSTRKGFSSMSEESRVSALNELAKHYSDVRISIVNQLSDLEALVARQPDLVFLGTSVIPTRLNSENDIVWLSEYFDENDIAYTGSDKIAHRYENDKPSAKDRVALMGIPTAKSLVIDGGATNPSTKHSLKYPLFVKPVDKGGGAGVNKQSYVVNQEELLAKVKSISNDHGADSLVEEYLPGREFSVAIIFDESSQQYLALPIELVTKPNTQGVSMLSAQVKSSNSEAALRVEDSELSAVVASAGLKIFKALGARDYGRIDIRLDANGVPNFLEANLIPSLIEGYGSFPKSCLINRGMSYLDVMESIVRLGLKRSTLNQASSRWVNRANVLPVEV